MYPARLLLVSVCGALASRVKWNQGKLYSALREVDATSATLLPLWGDASWKEPCWGEPDPEQQLNGEVLQSICARLHQKASFLVFGLGRDSALWYKNAGGKIVFLENHLDWLEYQEQDVADATRIVQYTTDATKYAEEMHDESKLAEFYDSLPIDIKQTRWDIILVDAPEGMEENYVPAFINSVLGKEHTLSMHPVQDTPGRTQSVYAARRLSHEKTLVYVDDFHRLVERKSVQELLEPSFRNLEVFSSGHTDNNGIEGQTAMLLHDP